MLLTRLLLIRKSRKMTSDWQDLILCHCHENEAVARFLRHKDFQAHLIGQFIHRSLYESNPIPPMLCYEDFAVFHGMLMQSEQNSLSTPRALLLHQASRQFCRALWTPAKFQRLSNARYRWKEHFRQATSIVNCHWFDIYSNHRSCLTDQQLQLVKQRVKAMYTLSFSSPPMFVLAIKKRVIEALWKK